MKAIAQFCKAVMKAKVHGHLFCMALQFGQWYRMLSKESEQEETVHDDGQESLQKRKTQAIPVLNVVSIPLQCSRAMGTYYRNVSVPSARHSRGTSMLCISGGWGIVRRSAGPVTLPGTQGDLDDASIVNVRDDADGPRDETLACCSGGVSGSGTESCFLADAEMQELDELPCVQVQ